VCRLDGGLRAFRLLIASFSYRVSSFLYGQRRLCSAVSVSARVVNWLSSLEFILVDILPLFPVP
jgi:hypothetical protein